MDLTPKPAAAVPDAPISIQYEPSGDTSLDVALDFIGALGIGPEHPAVKAAMIGNFVALEATLASLGDKAKGYERMIALGKSAYQAASDKATATATEVASAVVAVAGGQEQWNLIRAFASANADPSEKAQINAMMDAGPVQARAAAHMLKSAYEQANGTVITPADPTKPGTSPTPAYAAQTNLTRRDYADEVRKLSDRIGPANLEGSAEYAALNRRRQAAIG